MSGYVGGGDAPTFLLVHGLAHVQAIYPEGLGEPGFGQHGHVHALVRYRLGYLLLLLRTVEASDVPYHDGEALVLAGLIALLFFSAALRLCGRRGFRILLGLVRLSGLFWS